ncbi:MAG: hypothetical protein F6K28_55165 [Microcoleus sp. SIO2G3]|nr:hypothetical protein [Microcoleus sp. SIO2G3]
MLILRFGLAFTAALGIASASIARPAQAIETNAANRSDNSSQAIAAFAILGTGAVIIAYSAKQGNYLPQFNHSEDLQQAEQADSQLQRKLLRLLHNDRNAANRLLAQVKLNHPNRSANWVVEKVIYDLERDRNRH